MWLLFSYPIFPPISSLLSSSIYVFLNLFCSVERFSFLETNQRKSMNFDHFFIFFKNLSSEYFLIFKKPTIDWSYPESATISRDFWTWVIFSSSYYLYIYIFTYLHIYIFILFTYLHLHIIYIFYTCYII